MKGLISNIYSQMARNTYIQVAIFLLVGVLASISYYQAKSLMIVQDAWIWIIKSNVTANFILFLFMWGVFIDYATRDMPKKKGWAIWAVTLSIVILFFRFITGMETTFG